jgi:3',5'-cyclic-AMP phosphodiesterase
MPDYIETNNNDDGIDRRGFLSTAFPQPVPGTAPKAGAMKVPADKLRTIQRIWEVNYVETAHSLATIDSPLSSA